LFTKYNIKSARLSTEFLLTGPVKSFPPTSARLSSDKLCAVRSPSTLATRQLMLARSEDTNLLCDLGTDLHI